MGSASKYNKQASADSAAYFANRIMQTSVGLKKPIDTGQATVTEAAQMAKSAQKIYNHHPEIKRAYGFK